MNRFKKIFIITSIALNAVFFLLFAAVLAKYFYYKFTGDWPLFNLPIYSQMEYPNNAPYKKFVDDHDDDDDRDDDGRKMSRDFVRDLYSDVQVIENFRQLRQIQGDLIESSYQENYDEDKIRELFDNFDDIFLNNKDIVVDKLINHMREMDPQKRKFLMKNFLRLGSARPPKHR